MPSRPRAVSPGRIRPARKARRLQPVFRVPFEGPRRPGHHPVGEVAGEVVGPGIRSGGHQLVQGVELVDAAPGRTGHPVAGRVVGIGGASRDRTGAVGRSK